VRLGPDRFGRLQLDFLGVAVATPDYEQELVAGDRSQIRPRFGR
jgi:hypothetical protein